MHAFRTIVNEFLAN